MAVSVDTGSSGRNKRPLDAELNLIPFIDLLICCICFLLITAVWSQMGQIRVSQDRPGAGEVSDNHAPRPPLELLVAEDGYVLALGAERLAIPATASGMDHAELAKQLRRLRARLDRGRQLRVLAEDGVNYRHLVRAMDLALEAKFVDLKVSDALKRL